MIVLSPIAKTRRLNTLKLLETSGLKKQDLADGLGMSSSLLSAYLSKKPTKAIGDKVARRISDFFQIDPRQLDVDGEYLRSRTLQNVPVFSENKVPHDFNFIHVPFYLNTKAFLEFEYTHDENNPEIKMIAVDQAQLNESKIDGSDVKAIAVDGDAMLPKIPHGAKVLIDTSKKSINRDGGIYVIATGGLLLVRHVFKMPNDELRLVSSNPEKELYPDLYLSISDNYRVIGQVFHVAYNLRF